MGASDTEWIDLDEKIYNSAFNSERSSCWVKLEFNGSSSITPIKYSLPVYPEDITNSITTNYASYDIIGRSGQISAYNSTGDVTSSFSLHLHREINVTGSDVVTDRNNIDAIVSLIEAAQYPAYDSSGFYAPIITYKFGDTVISGKQTSINTKWSGPKINGMYMNVVLTISVTNLPTQVLDYKHIKDTNPRGYDRWISITENK